MTRVSSTCIFVAVLAMGVEAMKIQRDTQSLDNDMVEDFDVNKPKKVATFIALTGDFEEKPINRQALRQWTFFKTFLRSFYKTISPGYEHGIFLAYTDNDQYFALDKDFRTRFTDIFNDFFLEPENAREGIIKPTLHFTSYPHYEDGIRGCVRGYNAAFDTAIFDKRGFQYFLQACDDEDYKTPEWDRILTTALGEGMDGFGVVGGVETRNMQTRPILENPMVTRTHKQIFGTFLPDCFHNWFSDDWLAKMYLSVGKFRIVNEVKLENTIVTGTTSDVQRYQPAKEEQTTCLPPELTKGGDKLEKFIAKKQINLKVDHESLLKHGGLAKYRLWKGADGHFGA